MTLRLVPEFSHAVDLKKVSAGDVLAIVSGLVRISDSMESIATNSEVWDSLGRQHPMTVRVKGWLVKYIVDQKHERLVVVHVSRI